MAAAYSDIVGSKVDVQDNGLGMVDGNVVDGGPIGEAIKSVLEDDVVGRGVVSADANGREW